MGFVKFFAAAVIAVFGTIGFVSPASAAVVEPDDVFTFDNTLVATNGVTTLAPYPDCADPVVDGAPCNSAKSFGSESGDGYWEWASTAEDDGGGFIYNPAADIGESYTFFLKFQIITPSTGESYNKIVDYKDLQDDNGFYLVEEGDWYFTFYPLDTATTPYAVTEVLDLAVTRDATTKEFTVYTRAPGETTFTKEYAVEDKDGDAIPFLDTSNHTLLGFFSEDGNGSEAIQSGRVFDLRFWYDTALTEAQLNESLAASFTLTYDGNGATSGSVPNATSAAGEQTVADNSGGLQKTGYTFSGWNTQADGNGVTYAANSKITPESDVTLYAIWEPVLAETGSNDVGSGPLTVALVLAVAGLSIFLASRRRAFARTLV